MSHARRLFPKEYQLLVNGDAHHTEVIVIRIACVADRNRALLGTGTVLEELLLHIRIIWYNTVHKGQGQRYMDRLDLFLNLYIVCL